MPINGTYTHDPTTLTGANVWLLQNLADQGNMHIVFETVFLSDDLFYGSNRTAQLAYVFDVLGYDCLFTATPLRGERLLEANYLLANEEFGLSVVTALTGAGEYSARELLFAWTAPFQWQIWVTVVCALLFGAVAMFFFEVRARAAARPRRALTRRTLARARRATTAARTTATRS